MYQFKFFDIDGTVILEAIKLVQLLANPLLLSEGQTKGQKRTFQNALLAPDILISW